MISVTFRNMVCNPSVPLIPEPWFNLGVYWFLLSG